MRHPDRKQSAFDYAAQWVRRVVHIAALMMLAFGAGCGGEDLSEQSAETIQEGELDEQSVIDLAALTAGSCVAPPALSNPIRFVDRCPEDKGGPSVVNAGSRDVFIQLPKNRICGGGMSISGGRNVHILGGHLRLTRNANKVIALKDTSGTTFIEGVHIDVNMRYADAIASNGHKGRIIVQNSRIRGMSGAPNNTHGDVIHPQSGGPVREIMFQNVSGLSAYQGVFVPYRTNGHGTRRLVMKKVDLAYDPRIPASQKPLKLLVIGQKNPSPNQYGLRDFAPPDGTVLESVFIDGRVKKVSFTQPITPTPSAVRGSCGSFPGQPISGQVCQGPPGDGAFAPENAVGLRYNRSAFCR